MTERGYIAISRDFFDHPAFANEAFTEREAFQWLIKEAAWKDRTVRRGRVVIELQRGQLAHALSFMCEAWGWDSKSRVTRFLQKLKKMEIIDTLAERDATRITICNYDKYQSPGYAERNADRNAGDTLPTRSRNQQEPLNHSTIKPSLAREKFEEFWKAYPRREGSNPRKPAEEQFVRVVKAGEDPEAIIAGARRCAEKESKNVGTPYIPQAVKWLRDRRWEDYNASAVTELPSKENLERQWVSMLETQARTGTWPSQRIPEPGQADCPIPAEFIQNWKASRQGASV